MEFEETAERLKALGNPSRLKVYRTLVRAGKAGLSVARVREQVGIPASTLTHHLQRLMRVGLVYQVRRGVQLICFADYEAMVSTFTLFLRECCADEGVAIETGSEERT